MFYLVGQRTEKGMEYAKQAQLDQIYGTRNQFHFNENIWNRVFKVTSTLFEGTEGIRAYFKANRDEFASGKNPNWDEWLNADDTGANHPQVKINGGHTLSQNEDFRFFFMECSEFDALENVQRQKLGLIPIPIAA